MNDGKPDYSGDLWKKELLASVEQWLESFSEENTINDEGYESDTPDLYSFYSELCVLRSEYEKTSKRNHNFSAKFNESLSGIEVTLDEIASQVTEKISVDEDMNKENYLDEYKIKLLKPLTDIFVRFERIADKMQNPPKISWFTSSQKVNDNWKSLGHGFMLVKSHLDDLLAKEKISRITTVNNVFDPYTMIAIAVEERNDRPPNTVVEEIKPGFLLKDKILALAEVKVSKSKGT